MSLKTCAIKFTLKESKNLTNGLMLAHTKLRDFKEGGMYFKYVSGEESDEKYINIDIPYSRL